MPPPSTLFWHLSSKTLCCFATSSSIYMRSTISCTIVGLSEWPQWRPHAEKRPFAARSPLGLYLLRNVTNKQSWTNWTPRLWSWNGVKARTHNCTYSTYMYHIQYVASIQSLWWHFSMDGWLTVWYLSRLWYNRHVQNGIGQNKTAITQFFVAQTLISFKVRSSKLCQRCHVGWHGQCLPSWPQNHPPTHSALFDPFFRTVDTQMMRGTQWRVEKVLVHRRLIETSERAPIPLSSLSNCVCLHPLILPSFTAHTRAALAT